ncbi:hypothetical protein BN2476_80069 [Paraburkholderia piptadeniae]|uniref:Uncharacterized protein n=1 Tax=Paraburkholderia piptadeniae TaxID=1701573 RepID=A0A1N7RLZ0_9BURK|nr:hypothetical protein BN2476_80069 [Paraburkholderia piptadeniae]
MRLTDLRACDDAKEHGADESAGGSDAASIACAARRFIWYGERLEEAGFPICKKDGASRAACNHRML